MKDLFMSEEVGEATVKLLNFLAGGGRLGVFEGNAEVMERKIECLGCILTEGLQCVGSERIQRILNVPLPRTEGEL